MKKVKTILLAAAFALGVFSIISPLSVAAVNPYLPLWEHIPDGEPRVFEDPDNPGKYRAYIIGSHDVRFTAYCGLDIRAWSAPVEDLSNWRDEGPIFTFQDPATNLWDVMFAPDLVEVLRRDATGARTIKEYYLYPNNQASGRGAMVAKGPTPIGPFEPINLNDDGRTLKTGSILGFDPAVYVEYVDDPLDPDYEIGFRAYGYWGFQRSYAAELDQSTMYSLRPGAKTIDYFIPASSSYGVVRDPAGTTYPHVFEDEDLGAFNFFEAASIRKVGNKYVWVYSGYSGPDYGLGSTNSTLRYAFGDTPLGPWRSGGVLVDSRAPLVNQNGTALQTSYAGHNTHGSIQEINGQWYAFYHRAPRGHGYTRQAMVAPIIIDWDEKSVANGGKVTIRAYDPYAQNNIWTAKAGGNEYTGAEVTSEGFMLYGLDPYKYYSAGIACYLSNLNSQSSSWDIWDNNAPITDVKNGDIIGYKYFGFGGLNANDKGIKAFEGTKQGNNTEFNLFLTPKTSDSFKINVWLDGPWDNTAWGGKKMGVIEVPSGSENKTAQFSIDVSGFVDNLNGKNAVFLVAEGGADDLFDLIGLGFTSDEKKIERPIAPTVSIKVNGEEIELPSTPTRASADNGITGYNIYETAITLPLDTTAVPVVTASASDASVRTTVKPINTPFGTVAVDFNYKGIVKTYLIEFKSEATYGISASKLSPFGQLTSPYTQPVAQTVTITNTGTGSVTLTQPNAANFNVGELSTTVLASRGDTATFTIRPKAGLSPGNYGGAIIVSGSDSTRTIVYVDFEVLGEGYDPSTSGVSANTTALADVVTINDGWSEDYIYNENEINLKAGQAFKLEFTADLEAGTRFFVEAPQQPGNHGGFSPAMRNAPDIIDGGAMSNSVISEDKEGVYNVTWYAQIGEGGYQLKTFNGTVSPGDVTMTNIKLTLYTGANDPSLKEGEWAKITAHENGTVEATDITLNIYTGVLGTDEPETVDSGTDTTVITTPATVNSDKDNPPTGVIIGATTAIAVGAVIVITRKRKKV